MPSLIAVAVCIVVSLAVIGWQRSIQFGTPLELSASERFDSAMGICLTESKRFFYFFYYLGVFPVTSTVEPTVFSREGADEFLYRYGPTLASDLALPCAIGRAGGDWGKFFLFLPDAWQKGSAADPSTIRATSILFQIAMVACIVASFFAKRYVLGLALVLLLGSYKFQLNETYFRNNIFSVSASVCLLLFALTLRFMGRHSWVAKRTDWALVVISGVVLAMGAAVRSDALPLGASVAALLLFSGQPKGRGILLCAAFVLSLYLTRFGVSQYFNFKMSHAREYILKAGGYVYPGTPLEHHPIWHPIAAGLGDFGYNRGFIWGDKEMFSKALPTINSRFNLDLKPQGFFYAAPGTLPHQWQRPELMPEYIAVVRDMVLSAIRAEPQWYANILRKRIDLLRTHFSSVRLEWYGFECSLPLSLWILAPIPIAALLGRSLSYFKLAAFALPTCIIPIFITSVGGTVNLSILHLFVVAASVDACVFTVCELFRLVRRLCISNTTGDRSTALIRGFQNSEFRHD
jgi:hypothetical protein